MGLLLIFLMNAHAGIVFEDLEFIQVKPTNLQAPKQVSTNLAKKFQDFKNQCSSSDLSELADSVKDIHSYSQTSYRKYKYDFPKDSNIGIKLLQINSIISPKVLQLGAQVECPKTKKNFLSSYKSYYKMDKVSFPLSPAWLNVISDCLKQTCED